MPDPRSPHLNLPLPNPDGDLDTDVLRIRDAFISLDEKIALIDALLASDDVNLDALQEVVNLLKSDGAVIETILSTLLTKADSSAVNARLSILEDQQLLGISLL